MPRIRIIRDPFQGNGQAGVDSPAVSVPPEPAPKLPAAGELHRNPAPGTPIQVNPYSG
jgi:hypothetical protein